jgi:putative ABC transport system ATP-binding protein
MVNEPLRHLLTASSLNSSEYFPFLFMVYLFLFLSKKGVQFYVITLLLFAIANTLIGRRSQPTPQLAFPYEQAPLKSFFSVSPKAFPPAQHPLKSFFGMWVEATPVGIKTCYDCCLLQMPTIQNVFMHKSNLFRTVGLKKTYTMGEMVITALDSVDLEFQPGEFVVILGPSGSGKSTLLNLLGGLDVASEGKVFFRDKQVSPGEDSELTLFRRNHIGFVFQFYNLIPSLTALENVELVTELVENPMPAMEALELVELADRKDHFPAQLSGGQQQRVAIARAIAKNPELLLCDEPTGALDIKTGRIVLEAIQKVNQELKTTTLVITHNSSIAEIADRIIELRDGKIVKDSKNKNKKLLKDISW